MNSAPFNRPAVGDNSRGRGTVYSEQWIWMRARNKKSRAAERAAGLTREPERCRERHQGLRSRVAPKEDLCGPSPAPIPDLPNLQTVRRIDDTHISRVIR